MPPIPLRGAALALAFLGSLAFLRADRQEQPFDAGWKFRLGDEDGADKALAYGQVKAWLLPCGNRFADAPAAAPSGEPGGGPQPWAQPDFDDGAWRAVTLPHDWGVEGPFDIQRPGATGKLPWWGRAWYRKAFDVPAAARGSEVYLDVDGAMAYAMVWVNGKFAGGWPYGYSSFRVDLTPFLDFGGRNVVAIRLDNPRNSSRWYPGGGLYRHVRLVTVSPLHVAQWGTRVTTPEVAADRAKAVVECELENAGAAEAKATARTEVFALGADGKPSAAPVAADEASCAVPAGGGRTVSCVLPIPRPRLWSPESPDLYLAVTTVTGADGKPADVYRTTFGIRTAEFDAAKGFLLNGKPYKIDGVCDHSDLGPLGSAVFTRGLERQLEILKGMGCNALRATHNPPAPELLDLCDRMGILVIDEAFDCWETGKNPDDYHVLFPAWHAIDLRAMIRRDRNHPSIVLWSVGNEVREETPPRGVALARELTRIVRDADPARPSIAAFNSSVAPFNGVGRELGVYGFNYGLGDYGRFVKEEPAQPFLGSETASTVSTRGFYAFPVDPKQGGGCQDFQVSSYDLYAPPWGHTPDREFEALDKFPSCAGEFVWTGFDYLGEPTPYNGDATNLLNFHGDAEREKAKRELEKLGRIPVPSRSSYFGICDLCGFPKDRFYLYQARWRPDLPMVHILPHWTWPGREGQVTPVHVYTSGDEAELFVNGVSQGRKKRGPSQYRLRWDNVAYQPGEVKVVAYRDGKPWAEETVRTAGAPAALRLSADRTRVAADGNDLVYATVDIVDAQGNPVPDAANAVRFQVDGPADLAATDAGDPTALQPFHSETVPAFHGKALGIVRTRMGGEGAVTIRALADGLPPVHVTVAIAAPAPAVRPENSR